MSEDNGKKSDLLTGTFIAAAGVTAALKAVSMPRPGVTEGAAYLTSPGSLPLLLGAALVLGGLTISARALRSSGLLTREELRQALRSLKIPASQRLLLFLVCFCVYAAFLLGTFPFWLATFLYLFVALAALRPAGWGRIFFVALVVSLGLHILFDQILKLPLP